MPMRLSNALTAAMLNAIRTQANVGALAPRIQLREAAEPAAGTTTPTGTLIADYELTDGTGPTGTLADATAAGAGGSTSYNDLPLADQALANYNFTSTGYGALIDGNGDIVYTGNIGGPGSGATFEVNPLSGAENDAVSLVAGNLTLAQTGA